MTETRDGGGGSRDQKQIISDVVANWLKACLRILKNGRRTMYNIYYYNKYIYLERGISRMYTNRVSYLYVSDQRKKKKKIYKKLGIHMRACRRREKPQTLGRVSRETR